MAYSRIIEEISIKFSIAIGKNNDDWAIRSSILIVIIIFSMIYEGWDYGFIWDYNEDSIFYLYCSYKIEEKKHIKK